MWTKAGRWLLVAGMSAQLCGALPTVGAAGAERWEDSRDDWRDGDRYRRSRCDRYDGRERYRCERDRDRWADDRRDRHRERERERRKDAKKDGVVAGVVGAAVVGGIIAAIASDNSKKKKARERERYCSDRYGNYDARTDSYKDRDGRWRRCE